MLLHTRISIVYLVYQCLRSSVGLSSCFILFYFNWNEYRLSTWTLCYISSKTWATLATKRTLLVDATCVSVPLARITTWAFVNIWIEVINNFVLLLLYTLKNQMVYSTILGAWKKKNSLTWSDVGLTPSVRACVSFNRSRSTTDENARCYIV